MSNNKLDDETEEFFQSLRGRKKKLDKNAAIWIVAILLGFSLIAIGVIDYNADYNWVKSSEPVEFQEVREGVTINVTEQPIFGGVSVPTEGGFLPDMGITVHDWIILGVLVMIGMPSILIYEAEGKRLKGIDNQMPYLLREIADAQKIGMTLPRAIAEASKRNYGALTEELKKLAAKISWGIPFRDAMKSFRDAVGTPLSRQATILILEAERSGGELEKIFDSAQAYVQELLDIKKEREASITPYIYIIFVSYIIFAVVIFVLFTTFFAPFGVRTIISDTGEEVVAVPLRAFKVAFLYLLAIQGFFSGLTAGKMGRASVKLGLFYSTIMMAIGLIVHDFFILPRVEAIENEALGILPEGG